ncbi:hypothetical protein [Streptomyces sp. NPDC088812]|uniref:hypothetical protein n=1 Tax=Streptomyces sp. NPDC088812 TaxID=3365905 RepID=UPI00380DDA6B
MTGSAGAGRPLLFLDVDGPLIPFGPPSGRPRRTPAAAAPPTASPGPHNPLLERLDPAVGPRLLALGCDLVWATTWMDDANEAVAPRIGLPPLPVLRWPKTPADAAPRGLHWKTRHIVGWAGARPFIWADDEIGPVDRLWVSGSHEGRSLLHRVDPAEGLTDADFAAFTRWLRSVTADGPGAP